MILVQATCNYNFRHTQNCSLPSSGYTTLQPVDSASLEVLGSHLLAAPSCTCMVRCLDFSKLDFEDPCKGQATSSEKVVEVLLCFCSPSGTSGVVTMAGQLWSSVEDGYQRILLCSGSCIWMTNLNPLAAPTEVISPYLGQAKSGICLLLPLECTFPYSSIRLYEHTATHRGQYI